MSATKLVGRCELMYHRLGHCFIVRYLDCQVDQAHEAIYRWAADPDVPLDIVHAIAMAEHVGPLHSHFAVDLKRLEAPAAPAPEWGFWNFLKLLAAFGAAALLFRVIVVRGGL